MATTNFTAGGTNKKPFTELVCSPTLVGGLQQYSISLSAVHIFLSLTAFLGNALILVALHKESSLHPPSKLFYRCLATTDLCVGLVILSLSVTYQMALVHEDWSLCRYAYDAVFITSYTLCSVSLLTLTAISVDRLLAMSLGLRYRQVVTLKRTYIVVATFWVVSGVVASSYILDYRITLWCGYIVIPSCLVISIASYTKTFRALSHHHVQVQDNVQQQPIQPNALNLARYRKAVYSALWVQLALVVCYLPYSIFRIAVSSSDESSSHLIALRMTSVLIYFNSTLNPFLYCWKISEVRQAVKQTIRQALCCPWS